MRSRRDEFEARNAEVVVVTFASRERLSSYQKTYGAPFRVVTDEDLSLYRLLGFGRTSFARVWGWTTIRTYVRLLREGGKLEATHGDTRQLGGNAVIDHNGRLAWVRAANGPGDRPSVDDILQALDALPDADAR